MVVCPISSLRSPSSAVARGRSSNFIPGVCNETRRPHRLAANFLALRLLLGPKNAPQRPRELVHGSSCASSVLRSPGPQQEAAEIGAPCAVVWVCPPESESAQTPMSVAGRSAASCIGTAFCSSMCSSICPWMGLGVW